MPQISVVIPTRNRHRVLSDAIGSVLSQSFADIELIVVDDFSEDATPDLLAGISDPRFRWARFDRWRHGGAARNHGVAMARAPVIAFLDSDDVYLEHRLRDDWRFLADHPEVDVRLSSYEDVTESGSVAAVNPEAVFDHDELERYLVAYCLYLGGSGITIRRAAFDAVGGFDETVLRMQDREFLLRVSRSRGAAVTSDVNWVKRRSPDSISHQPSGQLRALAEMCRRHPVIREEYADIYRYLVAREILAPLVKGRLGVALATLREARANDLEVAVGRLASDYIVGKRRRQEIRAQMVQRFPGPPREALS
ncbi:MAG: glycosyltransferase family 2 protein [Rhizobiales bacterium]|nr:glycosyltransferase family 2 protein [Hyphomicrobiales bacterium]